MSEATNFWIAELEDEEMNYTGLWAVYDERGRYVTQYADRDKAARCAHLLGILATNGDAP